MKNSWKWVERAVLIAAIVGMYAGRQSDRAKWETKLDTLIENDEKRTEYWNRQNEINGRIIMYIEFDSDQSRAGQ